MSTLRELLLAGTKRPWSELVAPPFTKANVSLIVAAVNSLENHLDKIEKLEGDLAEAKEFSNSQAEAMERRNTRIEKLEAMLREAVIQEYMRAGQLHRSGCNLKVCWYCAARVLLSESPDGFIPPSDLEVTTPFPEDEAPTLQDGLYDLEEK